MTKSLVGLVVGAGLVGAASPATADTGWRLSPSPRAPFVVVVDDGVEPADVASSVGLSVKREFDSVFNGFAVDASALELGALRADRRVVSVRRDRVVVRADHDVSGGHPPGVSQITSYGQDRIGIYESRTARVDYRDQRVEADIAVFDSGVDPQHPELNVAGGVDCADAGTWADDDGHGTLVAGVAAALDNSIGVVGNAPGARVWSVRVENTRAQIFESALLCGFDWVLAQGGRIDVANLSLGIKARVRGDCGTEVNPSGNVRVVDPLHAAVCAANEAGVTVVAAAGNDAYDAERQLPAAYPEAVAVSAFVETDGQVGGDGPPPTCLPDAQDDHLAYFSNYGAVIELAAPGVCIPSTLPTDPTGAPLYANVSGTSFAAPHVAGAAALVRAQHPDYSPDQVRQRLQDVAAHDPLPGDPDGITEPILDLRNL